MSSKIHSLLIAAGRNFSILVAPTCRIQLLSALVLSRRVSVYSLLLSASCSLAAAQAVLGCSFPSGALLQAARARALHCVWKRCVTRHFRARALRRAQAVMGKKRRAFDDEADESEEDEISRHAEAAWLARRRAQQPPAPAAAAAPPRGPGHRTQGKGKPPKKKRKKPAPPPTETTEPEAQPKRSKSARKRAAAAAARERKAKAVKAEKKAKRKERWRQEGIKSKKAAGGRVARQTDKHGESRWGKKDGEDAPKPSAKPGGPKKS